MTGNGYGERYARAYNEERERLRQLLADDAAEYPHGHPCRDCGKLADEHDGSTECKGWR